MFRLSINIFSKTVFKCQPSALKLQARLNFPNRIEKYNICARYSTAAEGKPVENNIDNPEHIYHGMLTRQIRFVKLFSLTSSMIGVAVQPIFYEKAAQLGSVPMTVAVCGMVGFFTFVTPLLLHWITKKYVIDIDYDPKTQTYTATRISFFMINKKLSFKPEDVNIPDSLGMFTSCYIKGIPVFFDMRHFKDPEHYAKIMGYDKPMDFKLGNAILQESNEPKN